jgi:hypothetical protein
MGEYYPGVNADAQKGNPEFRGTIGSEVTNSRGVTTRSEGGGRYRTTTPVPKPIPQPEVATAEKINAINQASKPQSIDPNAQRIIEQNQRSAALIQNQRAINVMAEDRRTTNTTESSTPQSVLASKAFSTTNTITEVKAKEGFTDRQIEKARRVADQFQIKGEMYPEKALTSAAVSFSLGVVSGGAEVIRHPINTAVGAVATPVNLIQDVVIPGSTGAIEDTKKQIKQNPALFLGELTGQSIVLAKAVPFVANKVKDVYVATGSTELPVKTVLSKEVVEGKQTFPLSKGTNDALARFNKPTPEFNRDTLSNLKNNPNQFTSISPNPEPLKANNVFSKISRAAEGESIAVTGGAARNVLTGTGRIKDIDVVVKDSATGKLIAERVVEQNPGQFKVVQHSEFKDIYRLQDAKTGKIVADFDPMKLAEEGQIRNINKQSVEVNGVRVIDAETQLKSKVLQLEKGKAITEEGATAPKQVENIKQLTGLSNKDLFTNKVEVTTASPAKIQGTTVKTGSKPGLEDPGIFVAPKGEGSPYFLGLEKSGYNYEFSLNPFSGLFDQPTITDFKVNKVVTFPKEVLAKPGFEAIAEFAKDNIGNKQAYITKRSMIGQGELPRQQFIAPSDVMKGKLNVKKGDIRTEGATTEAEALILVGEKFKPTTKTTIGKLKGYDYYVKYKGRNIPVRKAELLGKDYVEVEPITPNIVTGKQVLRESSAYNNLNTRKLYIQNPLTKSNLLSTQSKQIVNKVELSSASSTSTLFTPRASSLNAKATSNGSYAVSAGSSYSRASISSATSGSSSSSSLGNSIGGGSSGTSGGGSSSGGSSSTSSITSRMGGSSGGGSSITTTTSGSDTIKKPILAYPKTSKKKRKKLFGVEVRRKGEFKRIAVTESEQVAVNTGIGAVRNTAAASFKVKDLTDNKIVTGFKSQLNPRVYYESKKEKGTFIQQRSQRIKTPGEKREITFKGIFANKQRAAL